LKIVVRLGENFKAKIMRYGAGKELISGIAGSQFYVDI
jgi:hypothetical protein